MRGLLLPAAGVPQWVTADSEAAALKLPTARVEIITMRQWLGITVGGHDYGVDLCLNISEDARWLRPQPAKNSNIPLILGHAFVTMSWWRIGAEVDSDGEATWGMLQLDDVWSCEEVLKMLQLWSAWRKAEARVLVLPAYINNKRAHKAVTRLRDAFREVPLPARCVDALSMVASTCKQT